MKLNVKLINKVIKHIEEEPRRFDMDCWIYENEEAPCGTSCCIAGWALILNRKRIPKNHNERERVIDLDKFPYSNSELITKRACKALGTSIKNASSLFLENHWPVKYRSKYFGGKALKKEKVHTRAIALLKEVIKTKGKILEDADNS